MSLKRSKTFPGSQKPEMDGMYERNYGGCDEQNGPWYFCAFRNGSWKMGSVFIEIAALETARSDAQCLPWRGLATRDGK